MSEELYREHINMHKTELLSSRRKQFNDWIKEHCDAGLRELTYQVGSIFYSNLNSHHLVELEPPAALEIARQTLELLKSAKGQNSAYKTSEVHYVQDHGPYVQFDLLTLDRNFLVDSLIELLQVNDVRLSFFNHPLVQLEFDDQGTLLSVIDSDRPNKDLPQYSLITFVVKEMEVTDAQKLLVEIQELFTSVEAVTEDFQPMLKLAQGYAEQGNTSRESADVQEERKELFQWLCDGGAVFLGYGEVYEIQLNSLKPDFLINPKGLCRVPGMVQEFLPQFSKLGNFFLRSKLGLNFFELETESLVHRRDFVQLVLTVDEDEMGRVKLIYFLILFTRKSTFSPSEQIPVARQKVMQVAHEFAGSRSSHTYLQALGLFTKLPKSELFRLDRDEMRAILDQVQFIREFESCRLYRYIDQTRNYLRLTFCLSNQYFSPEIFERINRKLTHSFGLEPEIKYYIHLGNNLYSHHVFYFPDNWQKETPQEDVALEEWVDQITLGWPEQLERLLFQKKPDSVVRLRPYLASFDQVYQAAFSAEQALSDLNNLFLLDSENQTIVEFEPDRSQGESKLSVYLPAEVTLSHLIPHLHRMGMTIIDENKFDFAFKEQKQGFLYQFQVTHGPIGSEEIGTVRQRVEEVLLAVLLDRTESDNLNGLVFSAGFNLDQVNLFQLYRNYYLQLDARYAKTSLNQCLLENKELVNLLFQLFELKHNPEGESASPDRLVSEITQEIFRVQTVQEDIIFKSFLNLIQSTVRTNYYIDDPQACLAVKIESGNVEQMPLPKPLYEIYVHGAHVEGIHLRGAMIARGGIRHSDRADDFRTEILGLMKTQMMKNVVIIPEGSKGGFVIKRQTSNRAELMAEGKRQYKHFMNSLLSLTDNLVGDQVIHPEGINVLDGPDPYLVVAADKGTAHLSDTANEISVERGFWLQDAFASGGSEGYDHKKMGITARGAWECVKLHFKEQKKDIQKEDFTVVGVGDMSGDVFGNGMLLSEHICLVGAFNHIHIFIDPAPSAAKTFIERKRLFETPGSSWKDFNAELISQGGGVFDRSAKSIELTPQIQDAIGTELDSVSGEELVRLLLKAPVELLWNGGIGTYVKATGEPNHLVGDPSNDNVRIEASELRVQVIGEGGNLGLTQEARVEFAFAGGRLNTDAIDNSAGVDTSDHEVNIKILVGQLINKRTVSQAQRSELLKSLTEEIAFHVLEHNQAQGRVLSLDFARSKQDVSPFLKAIGRLTKSGLLNRRTERLSTDEDLLNRAGQGVPRPDLSVLLAYSKMDLYKEVMADEKMLDHPILEDFYLNYFPANLAKQVDITVVKHPLKPQIIGTILVNHLLDRAGVTLLPKIRDLVECSGLDVIIAYHVADQLFSLEAIRQEILAEVGKSDLPLAYDLLEQIEQFLVPIVFGLILRHQNKNLNWDLIGEYQDSVKQFELLALRSLNEIQIKKFQTDVKSLTEKEVSSELSKAINYLPLFEQSLPAIRLSKRLGLPMEQAAMLNDSLEASFRINGLQADLMALKLSSEWEQRHRSVLVRRCQSIRLQILTAALDGNSEEPEAKLNRFMEENYSIYQEYKEEMVAYLSQDIASLASMAVLLGSLERLLEED